MKKKKKDKYASEVNPLSLNDIVRILCYGVVVAGVVAGIVSFAFMISRRIPPHEPLRSGCCILENEWYLDEWGWIEDADALIRYEEDFYIKTGIQPYIWITGDGGFMYMYDTDNLAKDLSIKYSELFNDEGHLMIALCEYPNDSGRFYPMLYAGDDAGKIIGEKEKKAIEEIFTNYFGSRLINEEFIGKSLNDSEDLVINGRYSAVYTQGLIILATMYLIYRIREYLHNKQIDKYTE